MQVRFTKEWRGPYGVFVQGRTCELSGAMLAAAPKDSYVAVIAEESKHTETTADKQQETPADKQQLTPKDKKARKAKKVTDHDGKAKNKKAEQHEKADA